ncbi:IclR family transcriptional regulator C-terminal domain-containing protein [Rhodoplanes sp. TEM]|uniref:IclR family transcriptional regulator C-terminal domain-containing protein n=1 Tax=Rhodoplanes tepidamans TaxID=200616 RepID=A0ABT5J798_RHOTP|nr:MULTISPECIES: IclR family transcriptional regulator C-terminal domain-containing protein [Rhodoplanes]MDC7785388.1 IclR family transcriptional regulator C-terminal domain-containing protein [Rhodoplanes tepidamans]MDC7984347.1 IclR family transcriptional regulator C-terminal domain-containing protein [Rhodoplanes sp. TEM]MDQ0353159.1 IclR family pca regulon transcriptional regulator [Rhodoplanes tepidamans]
MTEMDPDDPDEAPAAGHAAEGPVPGDPNIMTSLVRGLAVIQAFSRESASLTISQISQKTGIPRAAVRRCLYTLRALGFADTDDGRQYVLRPRILALGHAYLSSIPLARVAQPLLRRIADTLNESCSIAILDGDDIVYVARASVSRIMTIDLHVGSRLPAAFTSMGRVLLAHRPPAELDERLARVTFQPFTVHTIRDVAALRAEILRVRAAGYSVMDQELELGLRSIAVPILSADGAATAALNVGAHASRMSVADMVEKILPLLREAAEELSLCAG